MECGAFKMSDKDSMEPPPEEGIEIEPMDEFDCLELEKTIINEWGMQRSSLNRMICKYNIVSYRFVVVENRVDLNMYCITQQASLLFENAHALPCLVDSCSRSIPQTRVSSGM